MQNSQRYSKEQYRNEGRTYMAKEEQMTYLSANGTTKIHAVKWMPEDGKYKAILQITHGMIEYIERYHEFAEYLTERGFMQKIRVIRLLLICIACEQQFRERIRGYRIL